MRKDGENSIRFATNLITFFNAARWGLGERTSYAQWHDAFLADPRSFFDKMLDDVVEAGLIGVELAPDPGGWPSAIAAYGDSHGVQRALEARGLVLSSSYAPGRRLLGDVLADPDGQPALDEAFDRHAHFTRALGADVITMGNLARSRFGNDSPDDSATAADFEAPVSQEVMGFFTDQLNRLGAITWRHGVRIAVHTDAYSLCSREADIDTVMSLTDPRFIALCPDAGHITLDSGDPVRILEKHIARIPLMHWKDCIGRLSGHVLRGGQRERHAVMLKYFRILGSGVVDWDAWMRVLRRNEWGGWAIEEIDMSPNPVAELQTGLKFFYEHLSDSRVL